MRSNDWERENKNRELREALEETALNEITNPSPFTKFFSGLIAYILVGLIAALAIAGLLWAIIKVIGAM